MSTREPGEARILEQLLSTRKPGEVTKRYLDQARGILKERNFAGRQRRGDCPRPDGDCR